MLLEGPFMHLSSNWRKQKASSTAISIIIHCHSNELKLKVILSYRRNRRCPAFWHLWRWHFKRGHQFTHLVAKVKVSDHFGNERLWSIPLSNKMRFHLVSQKRWQQLPEAEVLVVKQQWKGDRSTMPPPPASVSALPSDFKTWPVRHCDWEASWDPFHPPCLPHLSKSSFCWQFITFNWSLSIVWHTEGPSQRQREARRQAVSTSADHEIVSP
jgi:hypothetical protein